MIDEDSSQALYNRVPLNTRCQLALPESEVYQEYHRLFMQKWNTSQWPISGGRDVPPPQISAIWEIDAEPLGFIQDQAERDGPIAWAKAGILSRKREEPLSRSKTEVHV